MIINKINLRLILVLVLCLGKSWIHAQATTQSNYTSDTTRININGKSYKFPLPAGYIDYNKLDSSYVKLIASLADNNIHPVLYYITSSNLLKIIASDSVFFTRYFELYYTNDILFPCGDEQFSKICDELCKNNYQKLSGAIATRLDSTLKNYFNGKYVNSDIKIKDLNFCQKKDRSWVYQVSIVNESVDTKNEKIKSSTVYTFGYIRINNRLFNFIYSDKLDEQITLEAYVAELDKILAKLYSFASFDSRDYFDLAVRSNSSLSYKDALLYTTESIKLNNKYADSYYLRAIVKNNLGDSIGALGDFDKYILLNPNFSDAYYNRGLILIKVGDNKRALNDLNKAIKLDSTRNIYYSMRGIAKRLNGDIIGACSDFDISIKLGNKDAMELKESICNYNPDIQWQEKGNLKLSQYDYQGAIADFTKAIEVNPKNLEAYYNRGVCRDNIKDYQGAIADYTRAIEINPKNAEAYYNRGRLKSLLSDYQGAIMDNTKAIEINPKLELPYYNRGFIKNNIKDYQGALMDFYDAPQN